MASHSNPQEQKKSDVAKAAREATPQAVEPELSKLPQQLAASLCVTCAKRRLITSGTGAVFLLCGEGLERLSHPKYPPQPVVSCAYFVRK